MEECDRGQADIGEQYDWGLTEADQKMLLGQGGEAKRRNCFMKILQENVEKVNHLAYKLAPNAFNPRQEEHSTKSFTGIFQVCKDWCKSRTHDTPWHSKEACEERPLLARRVRRGSDCIVYAGSELCGRQLGSECVWQQLRTARRRNSAESTRHGQCVVAREGPGQTPHGKTRKSERAVGREGPHNNEPNW